MSASEIVDAVVLFATLILGLAWVALVALAAVFAVGTVLAVPYALFSLLARAIRKARDAREDVAQREPEATPAPHGRHTSSRRGQRPSGGTPATSH